MKPDARIDDCHLEEDEEPMNIGDDTYMSKEETLTRFIVPPELNQMSSSLSKTKSNLGFRDSMRS